MATEVGIIIKLSGSAIAISSDGAQRNLQIGDRLFSDDIITTGATGAVEIELSDGSIMDLGRNSQAILDNDTFAPQASSKVEVDVEDDIAALQQALLDGTDPTQVGDATAADSGAPAENEGADGVADIIQIEHGKISVTPTAGFDTYGTSATSNSSGDDEDQNLAPVAEAAFIGTEEDAVYEEGALVVGAISAFDPNGDPITFELLSEAPAGLILNIDGSYSFDPSNEAYNSLGEGEQASPSIVDVRVSDHLGAFVDTTITIIITGTNDQPEVSLVTGSQAESDTGLNSFNGQLIATDDDSTDTSHRFSQVGDVTSDTADITNLSVSVAEDGSYTLTGDFNGLAEGETATVSFQYTADDGTTGVNGGESSTSDAGTVSLTITGTNDAPIATSISSQQSNDSEQISLDISGNFSDIDGDALSYSATGLPDGISINAQTGIINGTLGSSASQAGPYTITVTADDGHGETASSTFNWTVLNPGPNAVNDTASLNEDSSYTGSVAGNDSDPDGDALSFSLNNSVSHGTLNFNSNGSYTYTPSADFNGSDSFTYTVTDADGASDSATVVISIRAVNDAPKVDDFTDVEYEERDGLNSYTAALNVSDVDSATHTFSLSKIDVAAEFDTTDFSVVLNDINTGSFTITGDFNSLAVGQSTSVTFDFIAMDGDGADSNLGKVTLTIEGTNDQPVVTALSFEQNEKETGLNTFEGQLAATDVDDSAEHTFELNGVASVNNSLVIGLTVTIDSNGSYKVTGDFNALAVDETATVKFNYTANDGSSDVNGESNISDPETVTMIIIGANDKPVVTEVSVNTNEDSAVVTLNLLDGHATDIDASDDLDIKAGSLKFSVTSGPAPDINEEHDGIQFSVNNETGVLTIDPAQFNYLRGTTSDNKVTLEATFKVTDSHGGVVTNKATLVVNGINDKPTISVTAYETGIDTSNTVNEHEGNALSFDNSGAVTLVDPQHFDRNDLHATDIDSAHILVTGTLANIDDNQNYNDAFSLELNAGETLSIDVASTIDVSVYRLESNGSVTLVNAGDDNGAGTYIVRVAQDDANRATYNLDMTVNAITPANMPGLSSIAEIEQNYVVLNADGSVDDVSAQELSREEFNFVDDTHIAQVVTGHIGPSQRSDKHNDAFEFELKEGEIATLSFIDTTPSGSIITLYQFNESSRGWEGVTSADGKGRYVVRVVSADPAKSDDYELQILVDASTENYSSNEELTEDAVDSSGNLVASGRLRIEDADMGESFFAANTPTSNEGTAYGTFSIDENGNWTYSADNSQSAIQSLGVTESLTETFIVYSADGTASKPVIITITGTNDAPIAVDDENMDSYLDVTANHAHITVGDSAFDFTTAFTISQKVTHTGNGGIIFNKENAYELAVESDGSVRYALNEASGPNTWYWNDTGYNLAQGEEHHLSFVYDGANQTVTLYVDGTQVFTGSEHVPSSLANTKNELRFGERGSNSQPFEGRLDDIQIHSIALDDDAIAALSQGQNLPADLVARYDFNGAAPLTDLSGNGHTASLVSGAIIVDTLSSLEDTPVVINVSDLLLNDSDVDGSSLSITAVTDGAHGTAVLSSDKQTITYTPNSNYFGEDSFVYTLSDGSSSDTATVTFNVISVNDKPIIEINTNEINQTVDEDGLLTISSSAYTLSDVEDGNIALPTSVSAGHGSAVLESNGDITYQPYNNYHGSDTIKIEVTDNDGGKSVKSITVTVSPVNDAPVAVDDSEATFVAQEGYLDVTANHAHISVGDSAFDFTTAFTISQNVTHTGNGGIIFNKENAYELAVESDGSVRYALKQESGPNTWRWNDTGYNLAQDEEHHLSFVYDGANQTVALYVDGVHEFTGREHVPSSLANTSNELRFGERGSNNQSFEGKLDDIQIHSVVLDDDAIAALSQGQNVPAGLVARYDFNGNPSEGGPLIDLSGNGHDASLVNGAMIEAAIIENPFTTNEDEALTINKASLLGNDYDVDGDVLSIVKIDNQDISTGQIIALTNGHVSLNGDGNIVFTPAPNYSGSVSFEYTIADGNGETATATATLTVTPVADAPSLMLSVGGGLTYSYLLAAIESYDDNNPDNVYAYADVTDTTIEGKLDIANLAHKDAAISFSNNKGIAVQSDAETGVEKNRIENGEALVFFNGSGQSSGAQITFENANSDAIQWKAYDEKGRLVGEGDITGQNGSKVTILPTPAALFSYLVITGGDNTAPGSVGFNIKSMGFYPALTTTYTLTIDAALADASEVLGLVMIPESSLPDYAWITGHTPNSDGNYEIDASVSPVSLTLNTYAGFVNADDLNAITGSVTSTDGAERVTTETNVKIEVSDAGGAFLSFGAIARDDDNDILLQGDADDETLTGKNGSDILIGGAGNDILTGGTGDDIFVWHKVDATAGEPAHDEVTDFEGDVTSATATPHDVLDLSDLLSDSTYEIEGLAVANDPSDPGGDKHLQLSIKHASDSVVQTIDLSNVVVNSPESAADMLTNLLANGGINDGH